MTTIIILTMCAVLLGWLWTEISRVHRTSRDKPRTKI